MLQIPRHREFSITATIKESVNGPLANLSSYTSVRCQIREKTATRNREGFFENALVTDVVGTLSGTTNSTLTLSLAENIVTLVKPGDYLIDALALKTNGDYLVVLPKIPVRFVNSPTYQSPHPAEEV